MPEIAEVLERESRTVDLEDGDFERLLGRRERKQRNRRIRAGVVAVIVVLATGMFLARSLTSNRVPADPRPVGAGEILNGWHDLIAHDPDSGENRKIVETRSLPDWAVEITDAAWSPDRRWVAFRVRGSRSSAGAEPSLWIADTAGGAPRQLNPDQGWFPWAWSPTENRLAVVHGLEVTLFDVATGDETDLGTLHAPVDDFDGETVSSLVWSSDGTRIAYDGGDTHGTVYSIDVETGQHTVLVPQPAGTGGITSIDWSPDGEHLAIWYYDAAFIESPEGERAFNRYKARALYLANADGSGVRLVDRIYGDPNGWRASPGQNNGSAWSPDGTRVAYSAQVPSSPRWESVEIQVWTAATDGSPPTMVASECCFSDGGGPVWSPDGSQIAFATEKGGGTPAVTTDHLVVNADGTGAPREIDEMTYRSWQGGWFWCSCHG